MFPFKQLMTVVVRLNVMFHLFAMVSVQASTRVTTVQTTSTIHKARDGRGRTPTVGMLGDASTNVTEARPEVDPDPDPRVGPTVEVAVDHHTHQVGRGVGKERGPRAGVDPSVGVVNGVGVLTAEGHQAHISQTDM